MKSTIPLLTLVLATTLHADESLARILQQRQAEFAAKADDATKKAYEAGIQAVDGSGLLAKAVRAGQKAPDFTLKNAQGNEVKLSSLLQRGPVVLTWYRGGWCPYCNLTLAALQQALPEIHAAGAQLVALTPELPDKSLNTIEKNSLSFEVLTDLNHEVAKRYQVAFDLTDDVAKRYKERFDLTAYNGESAGATTLPLAATYIIDRDGIARYAYLNADYRKRAEPSEIVAFLREVMPSPTDHPGVAKVKEFWMRVWNPPHDLTAVDDLLTDDFVLSNPSGDIVGKAAFKQWLAEFHRKLGDARLTPFETFPSADGRRVVSRWRVTGTNHGLPGSTGDSLPVAFTGIAIWEIRDGKLAHNWVERTSWEPK